jgi:hypothetical protein
VANQLKTVEAGRVLSRDETKGAGKRRAALVVQNQIEYSIHNVRA